MFQETERLHVGTSVCPSDKQQSITIFSLQASPMKLECLTTGKLGNFPKLLVKWWRWASNTHSVFAFRCLQGQIQICVLAYLCVALNLLWKGNFSEFQSIIRVVFHDRRLQYTEHQQLEGWRWNRPGDRILDLGEHWMGKLLILMKCDGCVWKEFCCVALYAEFRISTVCLYYR